MKLYFLINDLSAGGAERALAILANEWAKKGDEAEIIAFSGKGEPPFYELHPKLRYEDIGAPKKTSFIARLWQLFLLRNVLRRKVRLALRQKPGQKTQGQEHAVGAFMISFMDQANLLALFSCSGLLPVLICEQVHPPYSSLAVLAKRYHCAKLFFFFRNQVYRKAKAIVLLSERSRKEFPAALQSRIHIIPNPLSPLEASGKELQALEGEEILLAVGRLNSQKNHKLLLEVFSNLAQKRPGLRLYILGEGPERERLEQQRRELGLEGKVFLPGNQKNIASALTQASVFVLPSRYEGFPLALLEAMSMSCACVASDCETGPSEILRHGKNGFLFPEGDAPSLERLLEQLLSDPALRQRLGAQAKEDVQCYAPKIIAEKWRKLLI
jgi:glycosyltransferase involved in cell wall biosynthesis